ncbi:MAG: hypothetical protein KHZ57_26495, partial [Hungatella hathewayi]|nr:hypothetical protein [Hungatella hathewayi]
GSQYLAHCLAKGRFLSIPRFTHICEAIWAHPVIKPAAMDILNAIANVFFMNDPPSCLSHLIAEVIIF